MLRKLMQTSLLLAALAVCTASFALPAGNYLKTCKRCSVSVTKYRRHHRTYRRRSLTCKCQRRDQSWSWSTLHRIHQCTGNIHNRNGNLYCAK